MLATLTDDWQRRLLRSSLPGWLSARLINDASTLFTNTILTQDSGLGGSQPGPGRFAMLKSPVDGTGTLGAMDHRLISSGLMTSWFPELAVAELRLFKEGQPPSGAISRTVGTIDLHLGIIQAAELSGGPDTPDISAGYAYQVYRYFQSTGDQRFLDEFFPSAKRALQYVGKLAEANGGLPSGPQPTTVRGRPRRTHRPRLPG